MFRDGIHGADSCLCISVLAVAHVFQDPHTQERTEDSCGPKTGHVLLSGHVSAPGHTFLHSHLVLVFQSIPAFLILTPTSDTQL